MSETMTVSTGADLVARAGNVVRASGRYQVIDLGRHRMMKELPDGSVISANKIGGLVLSDGTRVKLGIRPADELAAHDGKEVTVTGKVVAPRAPQPNVAQPTPEPSLVDIQDVSAAN